MKISQIVNLKIWFFTILLYNMNMDKKPLKVKDGCLAYLLAFAFSQTAVLIFTLLIMFIFSAIKKDITSAQAFLNNSVGYFLTVLVLDATLLAVFFFYNSKKENKILSKPKFNKTLIYILIGIAAFFCLYPIVACLDTLFTSWGAKLTDIPYSLTTKNYIISIFSLAILPAICEELLFRGLILKSLKNYGKVFSIVISALMFALFHMSFQQLIYPILMGLLLGVIMHKENNIIYCIVVHFINNFLSLTVAYLKINLIFNHFTYIILAIFLLITFLTLILYVILKHSKQEKQKFDAECKKYLILAFSIMLVIWIVINIINFK